MNLTLNLIISIYLITIINNVYVSRTSELDTGLYEQEDTAINISGLDDQIYTGDNEVINNR
jgi:hypothetical protein